MYHANNSHISNSLESSSRVGASEGRRTGAPVGKELPRERDGTSVRKSEIFFREQSDNRLAWAFAPPKQGILRKQVDQRGCLSITHSRRQRRREAKIIVRCRSWEDCGGPAPNVSEIATAVGPGVQGKPEAGEATETNVSTEESCLGDLAPYINPRATAEPQKRLPQVRVPAVQLVM